VLHVPQCVFPYDLPVAPQPGGRPQPGDPVLKATSPEPERPDQVGRDLFNEGEGRSSGRPHLGCSLDSREVPCIPAGQRLLTATPHGELRHTDSDDQQKYEGFDVRPVVDREPLVRLGQEEVEPHTCRHGCQYPGQSVPVRGYRDHHQHQ
jgi:hypothetical protein